MLAGLTRDYRNVFRTGIKVFATVHWIIKEAGGIPAQIEPVYSRDAEMHSFRQSCI
jgi:hypothetical protein